MPLLGLAQVSFLEDVEFPLGLLFPLPQTPPFGDFSFQQGTASLAPLFRLPQLEEFVVLSLDLFLQRL